MTFVYENLPPVALKRIDREEGRIYVDEQNNQYTSVTTALGVLSQRSIAKWKARVGEEEAGIVSKRASGKGTSLHAIAEDYILGKNQDKKYPHDVKYLFNSFLKKKLDNFVTTIYGTEKQLYSRELRAAGTADLICDFGGVPSICDIKTSKYQKRSDQIHPYFLQCASYAIMLEELFGFKVEQIVILMACHHDIGDIFIQDIGPWKTKARKFFTLYHDGFF